MGKPVVRVDVVIGSVLTGVIGLAIAVACAATLNKAGVWYLTDIETDTTFAAESWTIPHGAVIGRVSDFLFLGNLVDTDTSDAPLARNTAKVTT